MSPSNIGGFHFVQSMQKSGQHLLLPRVLEVLHFRNHTLVLFV
jgi:hypothetical protein